MNVLLIGAGRRMKEGIIPALYCLQDHFSITSIVSRTEKELSLFHDGWKMRTKMSLADIDFTKVDVIVVAVTIREVPRVLQDLSQHDVKHCTLMLDTPVLHHTHLGARKFFKHFSRVLATEDSIVLPPFVEAKKIIDAKKIGKLKHIYLWHNGYRYHALATLKSLVGVRAVKAMRQIKWTEECRETRIWFKNGVTATIVDPRDYEAGRFMIVGDKGCIVDYPLNCESETIFEIGYEMKNDNYQGIAVNGSAVSGDQLDTLFRKHISDDLYKKSRNNSLKIRALMSLFMSLTDKKSSLHYSVEDGLYDLLSMMVTEKFGRFKDFSFNKNRKGAFHKIISMVSRVMR